MEATISKNKQRVGLVLSGGGARGLAHIGVLKALEQANIPIDVVAATSMGGLISALWLSGLSASQIEAEILKHTASKKNLRKLVDLQLKPGGFVKGERLYKLLAELIGPALRFEDLPKPFALTAVDMLSGRDVVLDTGKVVDAVRATISVPGILAPVERDSMRLIDGGMLNNVPTNLARNLGADKIIAVNVMPAFSKNQPGQPQTEPFLELGKMPEFFRAQAHLQTIMTSALTDLRLALTPPDVLIRPQLAPDINVMSGFSRAPEIIEAGELAATQLLATIKSLTNPFHI